jgi:hypothetical protein
MSKILFKNLFIVALCFAIGGLANVAVAADSCVKCKVQGGDPGNSNDKDCKCTGNKSCECTGSGSSTVCTCKNNDGTGYECKRGGDGKCKCTPLCTTPNTPRTIEGEARMSAIGDAASGCVKSGGGVVVTK